MIYTAFQNVTAARLLAIFSVVTSLLAGCAQVPPLDDGVMRGSQLFNKGDYDGVIALLEPIVADNPEPSQITWDLLGKARFKKGQYAQAAQALERATAPGTFSGIPFGGRRSDMNSNGWLGWSYYYMGNYGRARVAFDKVLAPSDFRRDPDWDAEALRGRGWVRYFQLDFAGAAEDIAAAQRIALANPGSINATMNRDMSMALAYIGLATNRDDSARSMAAAAVATANEGQSNGKDLAPVFLMLNQRDEAYRLWGSTAYLGTELQNYRSPTQSGVRIQNVSDGSPALKAGLLPGDVIVSFDSLPVTDARQITSRIASRQPGESVRLDLLRNGKPVRATAVLADSSVRIGQHRLLQPVLAVRQLPTSPFAVLAAPENPDSPSPQVETPTSPELLIKAVRIEPPSVPPNERFNLKVDMYASDPSERKETVAVELRYSIAQEGKALARFAPETFQVANGVPSTITKKIRASTTVGNYSIRITLEMGSHIVHSEHTFNIR